ncbi:MAG: choice-of-anchor B family protein [Robiginitomaculum sp.]|nr:choice-of-anchor B family protein [Robiginitomaculum sp.]
MRKFFPMSACILVASCGGASTVSPTPPPPPPPVAVFGTGPADCVGGLADGYACNGITLEKNITLATFGAGYGNDIWGWTDPDTGIEYALMGLNNATAFVRIDNPKVPVLIGKLPTQTIASTWRDIKVYKNYAFITADVSGPHGMQIFDLTRLRTNNTNVTFTADALYSNFENAHNIAIDETSGYAYIVGTNTCGGGLHIVDISDPLNPVFQSCHAADGDTHDAQCVSYIGPDPDYAGSEICFDSNEDSIAIVDVSDKAAPASIASQVYPDLGFTHQAWLDDTQKFLVVNDEFDERNFRVRTSTIVFDVSDLDAPTYLYTHKGTTNSIDHNLYIVDNKMYQANYSSGLRILDFTDLATDTLTETAFFDTYPENNETGFDGAWSVYPFFTSGTIIVSDTRRGLFILAPQ